MFREANIEDIIVMCLLNTIQDKSTMIKVQQQLEDHTDWNKVRNKWQGPALGAHS